MAGQIDIKSDFIKTITVTEEFTMQPGSLCVGEWGSGVELQFMSAEGYFPYEDQAPGALFRVPSSGKLRFLHTSDSSVSIRKVPS